METAPAQTPETISPIATAFGMLLRIYPGCRYDAVWLFSAVQDGTKCTQTSRVPLMSSEPSETANGAPCFRLVRVRQEGRVVRIPATQTGLRHSAADNAAVVLGKDSWSYGLLLA